MGKEKGFTLIELLLIIAVLGALSAVGILYYQQRMQNQKIEKTVGQIQQWLQAGVAYYRDKGNWPPNIGELTNKDNPYIPNWATAAQQNPFCQAEACYAIGIQDKLFTVTATVNASRDILNSIAGQLPYATISEPAKTVIASIAVPAFGNISQQESILERVGFLEIRGRDGMNSPGSGSEKFIVSYHSPVRDKPDCSRYGKEYKLAVYPTQIMQSSADRIHGQQANFSMFAFRFLDYTDNAYWFSVCARPQIITYEKDLWSPKIWISSSGAESALSEAFNMVAQLFFVCTKGPVPGNVVDPFDCGFETSTL